MLNTERRGQVGLTSLGKTTRGSSTCRSSIELSARAETHHNSTDSHYLDVEEFRKMMGHASSNGSSLFSTEFSYSGTVSYHAIRNAHVQQQPPLNSPLRQYRDAILNGPKVLATLLHKTRHVVLPP